MLYGFWSVWLRWNIITVRGQNVRKRKAPKLYRYLDNETQSERERAHIRDTFLLSVRFGSVLEEVRSELYIYQDTNDKPKQTVTKSPQEKRINSQLIDKVTLNWAHAATTQMKQTHTPSEKMISMRAANYICHSTNLPFHELEQIRWNFFSALWPLFVSRFRVWFHFILITCVVRTVRRISFGFQTSRTSFSSAIIHGFCTWKMVGTTQADAIGLSHILNAIAMTTMHL